MDVTWWHLNFQRDVLLSRSLTPNTFRTYRTGINHYLRFCQRFGIPPLPLVEGMIENFCVSLQHRVAYKSIKVYLCGVQLFSTISGGHVKIEHMQRLEYVLSGIRRVQGNRFTRPLRTPITWALLKTICRYIVCTELPFDRDMLLSAVLVAFFGLLRVSEYVSPSPSVADSDSLSAGDVSIDWSRRVALIIYIKKSKTDPFRLGVTVRVSCVDHPLCPVPALQRFSARRGHRDGPLFVFANGSFLTRVRVLDLLTRSLPLVPNVNTHSFRRGGASALANAGVPGHVIQIMGRWRSDAYTQYLQLSDEFVARSNLDMTRESRR